MPLESPIVLVAKKEYLESFQRGELFMKNNLIYQEMENEDLQRGDIYDGAIKCGYEGYHLPHWVKKEAKNPRIVVRNTYIKSFFHYQEHDLTQIDDQLKQFSISTESAKALRSFKENYALLIFPPSKLIKKFYDACNKENIRPCLKNG